MRNQPVNLMEYPFIQLFHLKAQSLFMNFHTWVRKGLSLTHFFFPLMMGEKNYCSSYIAWKYQGRGIRQAIFTMLVFLDWRRTHYFWTKSSLVFFIWVEMKWISREEQHMRTRIKTKKVLRKR
ncbi:hypothetical protein PSUM_02065 [Pseudomonas umsongensis]|uniref:Uncharacterized protein n=1 Tax=Pseudomonas umsongensis TaxID=198618 RepID=A0ABX4E094_9PSED|nr:hypothetical protein PSUM_02065 [Pseudomonas umsongensis]